MKDIPDSWNDGWSPDPGVEVTIPRHTFTAFALRQPEAFAIARMFRVTRGVATTTVKFIPYSKELVAALKGAQEPGETITVGSQSWTLERGRIQWP